MLYVIQLALGARPSVPSLTKAGLARFTASYLSDLRLACFGSR